jgi:two-component system cell cycle sensor histidine kinase PleC
MISDLKRSRQAQEDQTAKLKEMAERYLEQMAEAEGANRAKSEFLAKMSHDLRTPLNAILGFSEIMGKELFGPLGNPRYHDYCSDISRSGQSLLAVIADILDMAELEAGKVKIERQTLPINDILREAFDAVRKEADAKGITLVDDMIASGTLYADPRAIKRILGHLLKNAVKFTPAGGRVTMSSRIVSGALNIYVDDTGVGIPEDALPKLAKPFTWVDLDSTKPSEGSGLGLAIARSFTELHGGELNIRSGEGQGTNVLVHLPLRDAPNRIAA